MSRQNHGIMAVLAAAVLLVAGCQRQSNESASAPPEPGVPVNTNDVAVIETKFGKMVAEFYHQDAPKTVANFQKLARTGFYNGTTFHRILPGTMIQGGDPLSKDPNSKLLGTGGPGYNIKAEFNDQPHRLGVLSMAHGAHADTAGSQFFICLNRLASLDGQFTAFGKLIAGVEVLKKIGEVPTKSIASGSEESVPVERIVIQSITILPREAAMK